MRGIVFRDEDGDLSLLRVFEDNSVDEKTISDFGDIYTQLPDTGADIVDIEDDSDKQMVFLQSICSLTFSENGTNCYARDAIRTTAQAVPERFREMINMAQGNATGTETTEKA